MPETKRTRFVHQWWDRAPDGKYLHKLDAPLGKRTPNGAVWGHSTDDLFLIQRIPNVNVVTCWSRSMIKEFGEQPIDDGNESHIVPRIRRPYPLLKVDEDVECPEGWMYSCFDEGSDHGESIPVDPEDTKETAAKGKKQADPLSSEQGQKYVYQGNGDYIHRSLEEHIPQQFFPDRLIVTDPYGVAFGKGKLQEENTQKPWIYERLYPSFSRNFSDKWFAEDLVTAELHLDPEGIVGVGNHSNVYRATFTLPKGLSARTPDGKVTVVAKTAFPESGHRVLLHNEAKIFGSFPRHFSEEWCGYNIISPLSWPVPVGPVVPKFYGYYLPTGESRDKLSPILLMEECGTPVDPDRLTLDQRTECHSLYLRFHSEGYLHQSTYIRNVVMQPGPLTRHPQERSLSTPSFRLIDFGRSINVEARVSKTVSELKEGLTEDQRIEERAKAYRTWGMNRAAEETEINREFDVGFEGVGSR